MSLWDPEPAIGYLLGLLVWLVLEVVDFVQYIVSPFSITVGKWEAYYEQILRSYREHCKSSSQRGIVSPPKWLQAAEFQLQTVGQSAEVSASRRLVILKQITDSFVERLDIEGQFERNADIGKVEIKSPVFIVGFPRTGSTIVHRLLARDEGNCAIFGWQMVAANRLAKSCPEWLKSKHSLLTRAAMSAGFFQDVMKIHPVDMKDAEECLFLLRRCGWDGYWSRYLNPDAFSDWLKSQSHSDLVEMYQFYKRQLQLILFMDKTYHSGKRLVLKLSEHMLLMDALLEVFPDAQFIHLLRKPEQVASSFPSFLRASVASVYQRPKQIDPIRVGKFALSTLALMSERFITSLECRKKAGHPLRLVNVHFDDFMADPINTIQRIHKDLGMKSELSRDLQSALHAYLRCHARTKYGNHRHCLSDFGLSQTEVRQALHAYCEAFSI